jgi:hypothetical protein
MNAGNSHSVQRQPLRVSSRETDARRVRPARSSTTPGKVYRFWAGVRRWRTFLSTVTTLVRVTIGILVVVLASQAGLWLLFKSGWRSRSSAQQRSTHLVAQ